MKEEDFLNAKIIFDELDVARSRYEDIDMLLEHETDNRRAFASLEIRVPQMSLDDSRPTFIKFTSEETKEICELVKSIRLNRVEILENKLSEI